MATTGARVSRRRLTLVLAPALIGGGLFAPRVEAAGGDESERVDALIDQAEAQPAPPAADFTVLLQDSDTGRLTVESVDALPGADELVAAAAADGQNVVSVGVDRWVSTLGNSYPGDYPADPGTSYNRAIGDMRLNDVWQTTTGAGIVVAVLDTGVEGSHPEFAGRLVAGREFLASRGTQAGVAGCTADTGYHGTHVASTIVGVKGNGVASYGVAPNAQVMPVCVLDGGGGYFSDVASGILWAADHGADIISMSLGAEMNGVDPVIESALSYAASRDVMVFAAAGNNGGGTNAPTYPGSSPQVITVGSVTSSDPYTADPANTRSSFSNYASGAVDVVATGSYVAAAVPYATNASGMGILSGTSMATPMAAGAAALVRAGLPSWSASQIRDLLIGSAQDLGPAGRDDQFGSGRIRPDLALAAAATPPGNGPSTTVPTPPTVTEPGARLDMVPSFRAIDTRLTSPVPAGGIVTVSVSVPADAMAISANITAVGLTSGGYLTVFAPSAGTSCESTPLPATSAVNFAAGDVRAAAGVFPVDAGRLCIFSSSTANVLVDVSGYLSRPAGTADTLSVSSGAGLVPVAPSRLADTRTGPMIGGNRTLEVSLGRSDLTAVQLNVTAVQPLSNGYLTIWPKNGSCDSTTRPNVSSLNVAAGDVRPNTVIVDAATGAFCVYSSSATHVLIDHIASFATGSTIRYQPITPLRALDTRQSRKIPAGQSAMVGLDLPDGVVAVQGNITALDASVSGYVTGYACGALPATSNVNFGPGEVSPNGGVLPVGGDALCLYTSAEANLIADINGVWIDAG